MQSMTTRVTLISHAATPIQRRAAFPLDEPLEEREISKIVGLKWQIPRAQRILAAPERRAQQTALALGLTPETATELRDCNYGMWNGREFDEVSSGDPAGVAEWLSNPLATPHGGDSIANLIARVGQWLDDSLETGHTVAVTHPAIIPRSAIVHALNAPPLAFWRIDITPLSLTDLRFNRKWTLRSTACPLRNLIEEIAE
jgi:broad specificity phosphatase PhoE